MIPIRDSIPSRTTPYVTYAIIALCSVSFLAQLMTADGGTQIIESFGMVPARLTDPDAQPVIVQQVLVQTTDGIFPQQIQRELTPPAVAPWLTVITCMFLHGGWMHFWGNMWFLHIFGDNVEDRLGHVGFLAMYLATGAIAGLAHWTADPSSPVPTIGASGAIAGVMGAYAWFYPHSRVLALLPLIIVMQFFVVPAPVFLGIWFVLQLLNGLGASGSMGGVAWWAHIGGFAAGGLVAFCIGRSKFGRDAVEEVRF